MKRWFFVPCLVVLFGVLVGCSILSGDHDTPPPVAGVTNDTSVCRALIVGLTRLTPKYWQGWDGDCPGADIDIMAIEMIAMDRKAEYVVLANEQATRKAIISAFRKLATGLSTGDCLVVYYSGHGGQAPDQNWDESDGQDEYLCPTDGPLLDDTLADLWQEVDPGVLIVFVSDSCNSETQFRSRGQVLAPSVPRSYRGKLIMFAGCADGKSSFGGPDGGKMTLALDRNLLPGMGWKALFAATIKSMPPYQLPKWSEYGTVTDADRNREVMR